MAACGASTSLFGYFAASPFIFMNVLNRTAEEVGLYYLLRNAADANPDPKTGLNRDISAAYFVEAVPAFTVPLKKSVATR